MSHCQLPLSRRESTLGFDKPACCGCCRLRRGGRPSRCLTTPPELCRPSRFDAAPDKKRDKSVKHVHFAKGPFKTNQSMRKIMSVPELEFLSVVAQTLGGLHTDCQRLRPKEKKHPERVHCEFCFKEPQISGCPNNGLSA